MRIWVILASVCLAGCELQKNGVVQLPTDTAANAQDDGTETATETEVETATDTSTATETETATTTDSRTETETTTETTEESETETQEPRIPCTVGAAFVSPDEFDFVMMGSAIQAMVQVDSLSSYNGYAVRWENANETVFLEAAVDGQGQAAYSGTDFTQQKGLQPMYARLVTPDGICEDTISRQLSVCASQIVNDFTVQPNNWTIYGDAYWDPGGWLEMTSAAQGKKGAMFNSLDVISGGATSIRFTLKTGDGLNTGADGFAFTIVDVANPADLEGLLDAAYSGGGLAYGFGGVYGSWSGDAFTVEIDTWKNTYNGTNELHTDPTDQSHIAVTQGADPSDHLVWFEVPDVEDYQPHDIRVDIYGGNLRVWYDGTEVISQPVNINFKGGHMFFSGSTGWATNYHIFDNLNILHECQ